MKQKLLFVCSRNRIRSLTAERLFANHPAYEARSVGTQPGARIVVTAGHLGWADVIICMEADHRAQLRRKFPEALAGKPLLCLNVPDEFVALEEALVDELRAQLGRVKVKRLT